MQAEEAEQGMERLYEKHGEEIMNGYAVCHGEPDYHHILIGNGYTAVTEFNQMHLGVQMEDLYYFLRKIMEKHDWNERLGRQIMETYERVLPITELERQGLYYLLLQCQQGLGACEEHGEDQKTGGTAGDAREVYPLFFLVGNFLN